MNYLINEIRKHIENKNYIFSVKYHGLEFYFSFVLDDDLVPWEVDGRGSVRVASLSKCGPDEVVIFSDGHNAHYYQYEKSLERAIKDKWTIAGVDGNGLAEDLMAKMAVEVDMHRMGQWLSGKWKYFTFKVEIFCFDIKLSEIEWGGIETDRIFDFISGIDCAVITAYGTAKNKVQVISENWKNVYEQLP